MSDKLSEPFTSPPVRDKRIAPPGILPRNMQTLLLGGIAAVMVAVIALSGGNTPKERSQSASNAVIDPNAARIQEYRERIEEQARKLQLEQAQLTLARQNAGNSHDSAAAPPGSAQATYGGDFGRRGSVGRDPIGSGDVREDPDESRIRAEKAKREYQSLFASNVALTFRKEPSPESPASSPSSDALAKMLAALTIVPAPAPVNAGALPTAPAGPSPQNASTTPGGAAAKEETARSATNAPQEGPVNRAGGKAYRLFEGTVLETVLTNRLDGAFSGPVNCMLATNVYSHDGRRLLISQGSRVLGEVRKVEAFGQERLAVFFHRIIMPDGYSVNLDRFQGLNQIGETGLRDQVNRHYLQVFGVSLAIGSIAGLANANAGTGADRSAGDAYEQGVSASLSQSSLRILDRFLNVLPTFTIREGHRVKVTLSQDLLLPSYDRHQMPDDL